MTETQMLTLTDFLLARIADDEASATVEYADYTMEQDRLGRVLAEAEAKRRIVELHQPGHECSQYDHRGDINACSYCHDLEDCSTSKLLALPYADHPDYREEWRP